MGNSYDIEIKTEILRKYGAGKTINELVNEYNISKSTIYSWIKIGKKKVSSSGKVFSYRTIQMLEGQIKKLTEYIEIYNKTGCTKLSCLDEKINAIFSIEDEYSIHTLCEAFSIRRSTFYHRSRRRNNETQLEKEDTKLIVAIREVLEASKYRLGIKKIRIKLQDSGIIVSTRRISRLMKEANLSLRPSVKTKRVYKKRKSDKYYINRLNQELNQVEPNSAWVSDITEVRVAKEKYYLCVIIDLFSRKIASYHVSDGQDATLFKNTFLRMVRKQC